MKTTCEHSKVQFIGMFSMIGSYHCRDCGIKIDPVIHALNEGTEHELFHPDNHDKLREYLSTRTEDQISLIHEDKLNDLKNLQIL
jgi:hypothetical protein